MENSVTSQQWKLISPKTSPKYFLITTAGLVSLTVLILALYSGDSCGIVHISIISQIDSYQKSLDPELCEEIVEQIDDFNETCEPKVEILDCG